MIIINKEVFKQIYHLIKKYDEIVIARHIGPDPDAVASQLALRDSIRLTFPEKKVYAVGAGVSKFKYLGFPDHVNFDSLTKVLLIVLDVPNFIRVDGIEGLKYNDIVKIDHHPREDIIGTADFTSNDYSSTAEMVTEVIFHTRLMMDQKIAEKLFIGIVADSERFLFKNTQIHTFEVVLKLLQKYQIDFVSLYPNLYNKSFNECRFEAYITNNLMITNNKLGYIIIDNNILEEYNVDSSTPSVIINNFNYIKDLMVWCFVTYDERNEIYKVNIRSQGPVINEVASKYNGGGHKYASGARIVNKDDIPKLFNDLDEVCKEYLEMDNNDENNQD